MKWECGLGYEMGMWTGQWSGNVDQAVKWEYGPGIEMGMRTGQWNGNVEWAIKWECGLGNEMRMWTGVRNGNVDLAMKWECGLGNEMGMWTGQWNGNVDWEMKWECGECMYVQEKCCCGIWWLAYPSSSWQRYLYGHTCYPPGRPDRWQSEVYTTHKHIHAHTHVWAIWTTHARVWWVLCCAYITSKSSEFLFLEQRRLSGRWLVLFEKFAQIAVRHVLHDH